MQLQLRFVSLLLPLYAAVTLAAPQGYDQGPVGAAYFLTNHESGNNIVIHSIFSNGTIQYAGSVSTGGLGATYQAPAPGPDALRSQGSIVVSGTNVYAVNAGSDSVSMFSINPNNPTQLRQVGGPVNSGGNFPVSVAASGRRGNVCVLNGGGNNGVQCFRPTPSGLVQIANSKRSLNLSETSPIPSNSNSSYSVSTILFSRDGSRLVADVKGIVDSGAPGFLAVWDVRSDGSLSQQAQNFPARSNAGQQNFGMTHLNGKEGYVMADASQGGLVYDFSGGYNSQYRVKDIVTQGQVITCWANYASKSNTYFFTDALATNINEYAIDDSLETTLVAQHHLPSDLVILDTSIGTFGSNQFLFQLAAVGFSIVVVDVQPNGNSNIIQSYNFTQPTADNNVPITIQMQGLAVYSKN